MTSAREWLADRVDGVALLLWRLAHRLRPGPGGDPCPDCRMPGYADVEPCPVCEDARERQYIENEIAQGAWSDGYTAAAQEVEWRG
jgi:hypothetical protein